MKTTTTTKRKRKRTKRMTKNQLLTILSDYSMLRACDDGYEHARSAGKTPAAMFHGVHVGERQWFFENLLAHRDVKDADAVRILGLRKVLFSLRKDLIAEFTPIVEGLLRWFDRIFTLGANSDIRRLLVSTLDALKFPDAYKRPKALVKAMSKVRFARYTPDEFPLDRYAVIGGGIAVLGNITITMREPRWGTCQTLAYFLRHVLQILTMGHEDDFKRNSTVLKTLHLLSYRYFPTEHFETPLMPGANPGLYSRKAQDRMNFMLRSIASRIPWARYERLLRKVFPEI